MDLAVVDYGSYKTRPSALLNSVFMTTVNAAAKTLVAVASNAKAADQQSEKWRPADHMRFMLMLMTWLAVWVLRVLMDHCPFATGSSYSLDGTSSSLDLMTLPSSSTGTSCFDLVLHDDSSIQAPSARALGRALTHILVLLNEIPASSRKYQFALGMADKIVDENTRCGHLEMLQVNRAALASAFARTSGLLYSSLKRPRMSEDSGTWPSRILRSLPLGSFVVSSLKGLGTFFPWVGSATSLLQNKRQVAVRVHEESVNDLAAEKHAQELLWITSKMVECGAVDEALVQWSLSSGLASISLSSYPRVQGFIVKITDNGLSYPVLTGYEKAEMEKTMNELISTLPTIDQEVILANWLQDFTTTSSDWPNLHRSYDLWTHSTREFISGDAHEGGQLCVF
ncbi:putative pentatricopeptide repeat-containing protein-like [Capsicum annuum]|nr:putative pentatricopeptide repeat-containing protein-like [Capsicum annuum]